MPHERMQQDGYENWTLTRYSTFNLSALRTMGNEFLLFISFLAHSLEWSLGEKRQHALAELWRTTAHQCVGKTERP